MAPVPLEGIQQSAAVNSSPQEGSRGGSVSLGILIDFIIQRTYHDITVLAELLPRKTDIERKIEIHNFSVRTRQLFVRLLALVKWANSASKVDKSSHIMAFLDKQSLLFIDTADMLARMARETLVHARLPNFHIPAAVEVLTVGTYSRLPSCIKEKIVPPDPITENERKSTLQRLNQIIQHKLVTKNLLLPMRNFKIDNGRVTFYVEQEFAVTLTMMGDNPTVPWRLLDLEILVSDHETGDGKPLVHPLQSRYVHQLIQARLGSSSDPLTEVFRILHSFCQSLQLEVLYSQTLRLIRDRLDEYIHIDEYVLGKNLNVLYWRELSNEDPKSELGYKLCIYANQNDTEKPLNVIHIPSIATKEIEIADKAIKASQLSMESLLVHTIYVRTRNRLLELKQEFEGILKGIECSLAGSPAVLAVPILQPCLRSELLLITVNTHTGMLRCHIPQYNAPLMPELTNVINGDHVRLPFLIKELKFWIMQRRCEKTLQHLPATPLDKLPLLYHSDHPVSKISKYRMYVQFHKHPNIILIVEFKEKETACGEVKCIFYLSIVKPCSIEDDPNDENIETELPKMYFRLQSLIEFDTFVMTHGPFTSINSGNSEYSSFSYESLDKNNKRQCFSTTGKVDANAMSQFRKPKLPAYFISELAHVVALCDERIHFILLAQELTKRQIVHQGLQVEANATGLVLKIIQLPPPSQNISSTASWYALLKRLLSVSIRVQCKGLVKNWLAELVFYGSPLTTNHPKEQGMRRPVYLQYEISTVETITRFVDSLLNDWAQIVNVHSLVFEFLKHYKLEKCNIRNIVSTKSYNYRKLVFSYGCNRAMTVTLEWNVSENKFNLLFGKSPGSKIGNPHCLLREQLEAHLNRYHNLTQIIHILNETLQPLVSIMKLPTTSQLGIHDKRPHIPVQSFTIIPQCVTLVRIAYQGMYCLELRLRGNGLVSLRDGAYSRFDRSNVVDEFTPTQGLKTFLSKYVDESAIFRRRSQSEDDNPPSPIAMDNESTIANVGYLTHHRSGPQSPAQQRDSLRFHTPLTPPSGSNPHTPSSPHGANMSQTNQHQNFGSSPATSFILASPPSLPPNTPNIMPHPSPSSGLVANSPLNQVHAASPVGLISTSSPGPCSAVQGAHSPASFIQTGHLDGSPFPSSQSMASPAASNWPGSPSVPRPSPLRAGHVALHSPQQLTDGRIVNQLSRVLPQRSWAGAVPTLLTHETLEILCCPSSHPCGLQCSDMSPLERFLGCVYMRRQLQRFIQTDESLTAISSNEPGVVHFKVETLQCRVCLNLQHLQSLHIKIQPLPEHKDQWSIEEIQILEKFFENRVVAPPYKPIALSTFGKMLNLPFNVLKDFIQLMKLDLFPNLHQPQLKWSIQWCLRVPPSVTPIVPAGQASVLVSKSKILFFLQITRNIAQYSIEPLSFAVPIIYDMGTNTTQIAEKRDPNQIITSFSLHLKRFSEYGTNPSECSILPAIRDVLMNFLLPSEASIPHPVASTVSNSQLPPSQISSSTVPLHTSINSGQGQYTVQNVSSIPMMSGPQ